MSVATLSAPGLVYDRLKMFRGFLVYTGRLDGSEFGVGGPNTHTEACELIGDRFVASRYEVNSGDASYNGVGIVGFDEENQEFTFTSYDSRGVVTKLRAPAEGNEGAAHASWRRTRRLLFPVEARQVFRARTLVRLPIHPWRRLVARAVAVCFG